MKGPIFFALLYLFKTAWAGGYQGCLERVWLYEAFAIDWEFNKEASRTIGFSCKGKNWDEETKTCKQWTPLVRHSLSIHHYPHIHSGEHSRRQYLPQDAAMTFSYMAVYSRTKRTAGSHYEALW
jgi:hypothetical protein